MNINTKKQMLNYYNLNYNTKTNWIKSYIIIFISQLYIEEYNLTNLPNFDIFNRPINRWTRKINFRLAETTLKCQKVKFKIQEKNPSFQIMNKFHLRMLLIKLCVRETLNNINKARKTAKKSSLNCYFWSIRKNKIKTRIYHWKRLLQNN